VLMRESPLTREEVQFLLDGIAHLALHFCASRVS
jgi:hypothetical protein